MWLADSWAGDQLTMNEGIQRLIHGLVRLALVDVLVFKSALEPNDLIFDEALILFEEWSYAPWGQSMVVA
jgi:hypothetical protein